MSQNDCSSRSLKLNVSSTLGEGRFIKILKSKDNCTAFCCHLRRFQSPTLPSQ